MNAEFQSVARRDKKAFIHEQCKEIDKSNRMGKMRSLRENERYQGNISCIDGPNKGERDGMDITEEENTEVSRIHRRSVQKRS